MLLSACGLAALAAGPAAGADGVAAIAAVAWTPFDLDKVAAGEPAVVDGAVPELIFAKAKALAAAGKSHEAHRLWAKLLEVDPSEARAAMVANGWVITAVDGPYPEGRHHPAWSPDGTRILFGYGALGSVHLRAGRVASIQTGGTRLEVHRWSRDGRHIIARNIVDKHPNLRIWRREGDASLQPTDMLPQPYEAVQGEFSPDGTRLLLSAVMKTVGQERMPMGVVLFDLGNGREALVPWRDPQRPARNHASWGPDGNTIVFQAYGSQNPKDRAVFAGRLDAPQSPVQLSGAAGGNCSLPRVSPCGQSVAYHHEAAGAPDMVMLARSDGDGPPFELAEGRQPAWSPDGTMLAYDTPTGIVIAHLGGMPRSPIGIVASATGDTLHVEIGNTAAVEQCLAVGCRVFDSQSVCVAQGTLCAEPVSTPPGRGIRGDMSIPRHTVDSARVAVLTVVSATGARAVTTANLAPPGP